MPEPPIALEPHTLGDGRVVNRVPNADQATIDTAGKLVQYALNPDHPEGAPKARVFASALGFTREHADELASELLDVVRTTTATRRPPHAYGHEFEVVAPITGPNGRTFPVVAAWFIEFGSSAPRLTTTYVDLSGADDPRVS